MRLAWQRVDALGLAYALVILLGLTLDLTGALHVYGLSALMSQRLAAGAALLLVGIALGWLVVVRQSEPCPESRAHDPAPGIPDDQPMPRSRSHPLSRIIPVLMLLAWIATIRNFLVFLAPGAPPLYAIVFGGGVLVLALACVQPPPPEWFIASAVLLGSAVRIGSFPYVPIDPARDDMLPLVQRALGNVLTGQNPYVIYHMPWELPLTYLPLTWLAYLPTYVIGIDMRLTNLLAELAIGVTVAWLARTLMYNQRPSNGTRPVDHWSNPGDISLLLWAWIFIQPTALNWSLATTAPVQWALLSITLALLITRRGYLAAVVLGLCAATSLLVAVVVPFALLSWLRSSGWRHTLRLAATAALVTVMVILPFFIWSPHQFIGGIWGWFNDNNQYPRLRWDMDHTWARMVGFSGIFWRHSLVGLLKPLQMVLLTLLASLYWHWGATPWRLAAFAVTAFLLFTVFNPVLWPYLYNPALIAALLAVTTLAASMSSQTAIGRRKIDSIPESQKTLNVNREA